VDVRAPSIEIRLTVDVRVPSKEFNSFATVLHDSTNLLLARFASLIMWEHLPEQNWFSA